jgi:hypothetical protein
MKKKIGANHRRRWPQDSLNGNAPQLDEFLGFTETSPGAPVSGLRLLYAFQFLISPGSAIPGLMCESLEESRGEEQHHFSRRKLIECGSIPPCKPDYFSQSLLYCVSRQ